MFCLFVTGILSSAFLGANQRCHDQTIVLPFLTAITALPLLIFAFVTSNLTKAFPLPSRYIGSEAKLTRFASSAQTICAPFIPLFALLFVFSIQGSLIGAPVWSTNSASIYFLDRENFYMHLYSYHHS